MLPQELASLWDVPISLQEWCGTHSMEHLLPQLLLSCPGKILLLGADLIITHWFRGGWCSDPVARDPPPAVVVQRPLHTTEAEDMDGNLGLLDGYVVKDDCQKADDAEVPVHLWDYCFQQAYTSAGYVLPGRWREALAGFRIGFSRLWKRRVLFSFWSHVKSRTRQEYHVTRDCLAAWCKPFSRPGIRIGRHKYAFDWIYRWTTGGRVAYCRAANRLLAHPPIARDWEAARDAMSRVANST